MMKTLTTMLLALMLGASALAQNVSVVNSVRAESDYNIRAMAKEANIYANPVVDSYRILYGYFVDRDDPDFKAPWNRIENVKAIQAGDAGQPLSAFLGRPVPRGAPAIDFIEP